MADDVRVRRGPIHPLHAILLAFPFPLLLGALLSDLGYYRTFQIQWVNFASWLITGALVVGTLALIWALISMIGGRRDGSRRPTIYFLVLLAMWVVAFIDALIHARDGWAVMPAGLILSAIAALLAFVASWIGYSGIRRTEVVR